MDARTCGVSLHHHWRGSREEESTTDNKDGPGSLGRVRAATTPSQTVPLRQRSRAEYTRSFTQQTPDHKPDMTHKRLGENVHTSEVASRTLRRDPCS
eukprot:scaffold4755_cov123-Isochrysis_galbana.AAC.5